MEPKEAQSGGDADEETMARKRARRVSFAETTAVHVFDRDEDFDTPPDLRPGGGEDSETRPLVGFPVEHSDSDDSKGSVREEDDEEEEEQESFLRDMNSYSPGSVADSVTSNDGNSFFFYLSSLSQMFFFFKVFFLHKKMVQLVRNFMFFVDYYLVVLTFVK